MWPPVRGILPPIKPISFARSGRAPVGRTESHHEQRRLKVYKPEARHFAEQIPQSQIDTGNRIHHQPPEPE